MSFSEATLRFVSSTQWDGEVESTPYVGIAGVKGEGPYVKISLSVKEGVVQQARFETYSCPAARASCAALCWVLEGKDVALCETIDGSSLRMILGVLPEGKGHLADLAVQALRLAIDM